MKKLIGYGLVYKNRNSFVLYDGAFYKDKTKSLKSDAKEIAQSLKKKIFIRKIFLSLRGGK